MVIVNVMEKDTTTTAAQEAYRPPPLDDELSAKIFAEADRKKVAPSKVFRYWLRLGIQTEAKIKSILP